MGSKGIFRGFFLSLITFWRIGKERNELEGTRTEKRREEGKGGALG